MHLTLYQPGFGGGVRGRRGVSVPYVLSAMSIHTLSPEVTIIIALEHNITIWSNSLLHAFFDRDSFGCHGNMFLCPVHVHMPRHST